MNEGDLGAVFSQYGDITEINLVRDQETGSSRGFAFLRYADQRSTILAVDNLNGITLGQRTLQVDHVQKYRSPEELKAERETKKKHKGHGGKYASLVTEDVFRTALGEYLARPTDMERTIEQTGEIESTGTGTQSSLVVEQRTIKRPRTEAEKELRKKFKEGELSLQEYEIAKDILKKELKKRT